MGAMMIMNLSKGVSEHAVKQNLMFFIIFLLIYQCVGFIFVYIYIYIIIIVIIIMIIIIIK